MIIYVLLYIHYILSITTSCSNVEVQEDTYNHDVKSLLQASSPEGSAMVQNILHKKIPRFVNFVLNDKEYIYGSDKKPPIDNQKILNMVCVSNCWRNIGGCYGPPCCFKIPSVSICQALRSIMGNKWWLAGAVCSTLEIQNTAYSAVENETRYFKVMIPGNVNSILNDSNNMLMRQIGSLGTLSAQQTQALHAILHWNEHSPPSDMEEEEGDEGDDEW